MQLENLAIKIARSENLPVLPEIVSSVLRMADDPDASGRALERLIERDPAITAKVLKAANSSYYGGNTVPTVGRALSLLGLNTIKSLVISVAFQQMVGARPQSSLFNKVNFWRHSLAVATASRLIAKMKMPQKAEELYGSAILHDVGMLVLDRFCPEHLDEAIRAAAAKDIAFHEAEQQLFGFDHAAVGGLLAEKWGLPETIAAAIKYHHEPFRDEMHMDCTCIVAAADVLAHQCGLSNNTPNTVSYEIDLLVQHNLEMPLEQLAIIGKVMYEEVLRAQTAFHIAA